MPLDYLDPNIYEMEYVYWPWGDLIEAVVRLVTRLAPPHGCVLDYMCGTGYLLGQIARSRSDLRLIGCSLGRQDYIAYGVDKYPQTELFHADALAFVPRVVPNLITCTGGLHHLRPEDRHAFLSKVTAELEPGGWLIVGEEVLSPYVDEGSRRAAALELNSDVLRYSIAHDAPVEVLQAGVDVLRGDLLQLDEYKLTEEGLRNLLDSFIPIAAVERTWPPDSALLYGDRVILCGPKPDCGGSEEGR